MTTIKITKHGFEPGCTDDYWWNVPHEKRHALAVRVEAIRMQQRAAAYASRLVREAEARFNGFGVASARDLEHRARTEERLWLEGQEFVEWLNSNGEYECTPQRAAKNETAMQIENDNFFRDGRLYA